MRYLALLFLLLCGIASSQELPESNPTEVWVKGRLVQHSWRDGRIFISTQDARTLLRYSSELPQVDLVEALQERGDYVWKVSGGKFEATRDRSKYSVGTNRSKAIASNRRARARRTRSSGATAAARDSNLIYRVKEFESENGFVRAYITVTNEGAGMSDPSEMLSEFQDGFGKTYATVRSNLKALKPGESTEIEAFSMVREQDTSFTPTSDNVLVHFFSLTNPNKNPTSVSEARRKARKKKTRTRVKSRLDFNNLPGTRRSGIGLD